MKKVFLVLFLILSIGIVSGCAKKAPMDQLGKNGLFNYSNEFLHFCLALPADFIYYQTQRISGVGYNDLQFFVPTADAEYAPQEISGYANPVTIRVYEKDYWYNKMDDSQRATYVKIGEKKARVYAIIFWDKVPSDWQKKWNEELKQALIKNFKTT